MSRLKDQDDSLFTLDHAVDQRAAHPAGGNWPHSSPQDGLRLVAGNRKQLGAEAQDDEVLLWPDRGGGKVEKMPDVNDRTGRSVVVDHTKQAR
jgi:hypothetical protein